jgi:hypothetical protein
MSIGAPDMWFEFTLTGHGWADARISDGETSADLTASYVADALRDLLYAVWRSGEGDPEVRCSWQEEPGEYRWILHRDGRLVKLTILWVDRQVPHRPDSAGRLVFDTSQPWDTLASAIVKGATRTLAVHGDEGYGDSWQLPFPRDIYQLLKNQLRRTHADDEPAITGAD